MLILTRLPQQSVLIGEEVRVTVLDVKQDRVRLGIVAPAAIKVNRSERCEAVAPQEPQTGAQTP